MSPKKFLKILTVFIGVEGGIYVLEKCYRNFGKGYLTFDELWEIFGEFALLFLELYGLAWIHYRLLMALVGKNAKERQYEIVRDGTLSFAVLIGVLAIYLSFQGHNFEAILIFGTPPLSMLSVLVFFIIAMLLGLGASDKVMGRNKAETLISDVSTMTKSKTNLLSRGMYLLLTLLLLGVFYFLSLMVSH